MANTTTQVEKTHQGIGQLRMTYNSKDNGHRMSEYVTNKAHEIATASGATIVAPANPRLAVFVVDYKDHPLTISDEK